MRNLVLVFFSLLLCACSSETLDKTYNSLEKYNKNEYHLIYKDVTENKNNPYEIEIAVKENKYYYSDELNTIIQKENKKYTLNEELFTYNAEDISEYEDYTYGMFDIPKEKLKKYKAGKTTLYGEKLSYEQFDYNENTIKYYFKNEKLKYVRIKGLVNKTIEIIVFDKEIDDELFELPTAYHMITY